MFRHASLLLILLFSVLAAACSGNSTEMPQTLGQPEIPPVLSHDQKGFPTELPQDGIQPWETTGRQGAGIDAGSEFTPGREWFLGSSQGLTENGEAAHLESGPGATSYAIWRMSLGGSQPGTLAVDVNPLDKGAGIQSEYYVGIANYGSGRWDWHGPFTDNHVRISTGKRIVAGADYLSTQQNVFVSVLTNDGSNVDVVGIGLNPFDDSDEEAPAQPTGLSATAVRGGAELSWNPQFDPDLAGYLLHWSGSGFINPLSAGVRTGISLEGSSLRLLELPAARQFIRVSAVDHSGNVSIPSDQINVQPLPGNPLHLLLLADQVSGGIGQPVELSATGADEYDFDTDGDGSFDVIGNTSGLVSVDTENTGIIRPRVRATSGGGEAVALGAVSVIIAANSRPVASALASPQSGIAPLDVTFTGTAEDTEDEVSELTLAWDFDGDGIFEADTDTLTPPVQNYAAGGLFNAKFRVMDSEGAWDVDTVSILAFGDPPNSAPTAVLESVISEGNVPLTITFVADQSMDPDGDSLEYAWDWDGNGGYDEFGSADTLEHTFTAPGQFDVTLRVDDGRGGLSMDTLSINATVQGNESPVADLLPASQNGDIPLTVDFDASGSNAGGDIGDSIVLYEWDFDGNGNYDGYGEDATISQLYTSAGTFTAKLRVTDSFGAQATDTAEITVTDPANGSPTASFVISKDVGDVPFSVEFDASSSTDDNGVVLYEWDWDGDGTYDSYSAQPLAANSYSVAGNYSPTLRVSDAQGITDTASVSVTVRGWRPYPALLDTGSMGRLSIVKEGTVLALAYFANPSGSNDEVRFSRTTDLALTSWTAPVTAASGLDFPLNQDLSISIIDGNPAIAFEDPVTADLEYVRAVNAAGSSWGSVVTVDGSINIDGSMSLADVNGAPCIAYYNISSGDLMFVRANNSAGSSWASPQTLESSGSTGKGPSLLVANGNPLVSYVNSTDGTIKVIRATNGIGTTWDTPIVVESLSAGSPFSITRMWLRSSKPVLLYGDTLDNLYVESSSNFDGTTWGSQQTLSTGINFSWISVNASLGDRVVFDDLDDFNLYQTQTKWTGATLWGEPQLLSETGDLRYPVIETANGVTVVMFRQDFGSNGIAGYMFID